ncbi:MAG: lasso peptide isopeptide bond-forming cyclase [Chloroflexi bacterium]|nr:lasso peptide isopeptide bond-forming cyclase [Chloroflexota bacterium]
MSGIAGLVRHSGQPASPKELEGMLDVMSYRGPDGRHVWNRGATGLGHAMLHTTPESLGETLPLVSRNGDFVITADVRLDNRKELISELGWSNGGGEGTGDSRLILSAYERWGEDCTKHLVGDFAFAIADGRTQTLFCARDHFGVKPFYYCNDGDIFAFASEIKGILSLSAIPRVLDEVAVGDYLTSTLNDVERTFYKDIRRLAPGHQLTIRHGDMAVRRYWALDPSRELLLGSDEEYVEGFREAFHNAVRSRMRSAHPVGSFLSGGLDSSSITCVAREMAKGQDYGRLSTFSAVFDDVAESDESQYLNLVLSQNGVDPEVIRGDRLSPLVDLERRMKHEDEPILAYNLHLNWSLFEAASKKNVRVMLDGFDGDTTISHGTGLLRELGRNRRWFALARESRALSKHSKVSAWKQVSRSVWHYQVKHWIPKPVRSTLSAIRSGLRGGSDTHDEPGWQAYVNKDFARRVGLRERIESYKNPSEKTEREGHFNRLTWGVMPYTLEVLDRSAAAFGIEPRYPFWDKRLVEYCLSLPPQQKLRNGWTRWVLRAAMEGTLPPGIQWRGRKSNLGPGFEHGLRTFETKRIREVICENSENLSRYLDIDALKQTAHRFAATEVDGDSVVLWKATNLAMWLKKANISA